MYRGAYRVYTGVYYRGVYRGVYGAYGETGYTETRREERKGEAWGGQKRIEHRKRRHGGSGQEHTGHGGKGGWGRGGFKDQHEERRGPK